MGKQILEGSRAIAETINLCHPDVISAYPITPQTHIVEDLAQFKADGKADYEYVRAESEFAAASIVLGASAAGSRVYTATSSQGLLLMTEVLFNIAGMRLPMVLTCANRAISAPINIWNDHQDAMTVRDAGWIMLFAENVQEAVDMHIMAFKISETLNLPVMVNMDGFILTHTYEPVEIPSASLVNKFIGKYKPIKGQFLNVNNPCTLGAFAAPADYQGIREELQDDLMKSKKVINEVSGEYYKKFQISNFKFQKNFKSQILNGLLEYIGPKNPEVVIVAMGSVIGTIKDTVNTPPSPFSRGGGKAANNKMTGNDKIGILKIKTFRPFPAKEVCEILKKAKYVAVLDKAISLGYEGILAGEVKQALYGTGVKIKSYISGLGGRDITREMVKGMVKDVIGRSEGVKFI